MALAGPSAAGLLWRSRPRPLASEGRPDAALVGVWWNPASKGENSAGVPLRLGQVGTT